MQNRKFNISAGTDGEHCSKRNATSQHQYKGFYSAYHWLICLTYIYYAWYYQTFIVSPAFCIGVTALKLCKAISDAKDNLYWAYRSLWKWNQNIILILSFLPNDYIFLKFVIGSWSLHHNNNNNIYKNVFERTSNL